MTNINANILKNFIVKNLGVYHLTRQDAIKNGIDTKMFAEANTDENNYLEINEILDNEDLYEQFATMFVQEQENKTVKDKDKEKEEQSKVTDKSNAKA